MYLLVGYELCALLCRHYYVPVVRKNDHLIGLQPIDRADEVFGRWILAGAAADDAGAIQIPKDRMQSVALRHSDDRHDR